MRLLSANNIKLKASHTQLHEGIDDTFVSDKEVGWYVGALQLGAVICERSDEVSLFCSEAG